MRSFGPGQVGEDADLDARAFGRFAHRLRARDLRRGIAMGEVQPDHVHARAQQRVEHARRIGGRTERGEDLGATAMSSVHGKLSPPRHASTASRHRPDCDHAARPTRPRIDIAATLAALPAFPRLQGKRVRLRGPRADDADAVFALFADPDVMRYWSRRR